MEIKGLVGGIQKFSTEDGPGIRSTVFLKGCPLQCQWCHNPELIAPKNQLMYNSNRCISCGQCAAVCREGAITFPDGVFRLDREKCLSCFHCVEVCYDGALRTAAKLMSVSEVMRQVEQDCSFYRHTGGGMTISGGELLFQYRFADALLDAAIDRDINTALDTSGYGRGELLMRLARKADYILFDLKSIDNDVHQKFIGAPNAVILKNLSFLAAEESINPKILIRMPLVSGVNDGAEMMETTCSFLVHNKLKSVTLLPYHKLGIVKYTNLGMESHSFAPPSDERLEEIRLQFMSAGINTDILSANR